MAAVLLKSLVGDGSTTAVSTSVLTAGYSPAAHSRKEHKREVSSLDIVGMISC